jgi:hypothetical protein
MSEVGVYIENGQIVEAMKINHHLNDDGKPVATTPLEEFKLRTTKRGYTFRYRGRTWLVIESTDETDAILAKQSAELESFLQLAKEEHLFIMAIKPTINDAIQDAVGYILSGEYHFTSDNSSDTSSFAWNGVIDRDIYPCISLTPDASEAIGFKIKVGSSDLCREGDYVASLIMHHEGKITLAKYKKWLKGQISDIVTDCANILLSQQRAVTDYRNIRWALSRHRVNDVQI